MTTEGGDALHETHPEIIKRLRRAEGHLRGIVAMLESHRPCLEVAQQLQAVEKAITSAKKVLIRDHIDHCLAVSTGGAHGDPRAAVEEFKAITKYL